MFHSFVAAAALAVAPAAGESAACAPLPGIEAVLARPALTYLLFGEYHGTREMPEVTAAALCAAAATGRPIVLAVEFPVAEQGLLDAYMASDGGVAARGSLLQAAIWKEEGGRASKAVADLIETARVLGKRHRVKLLAFDAAPEPGTSERREAAMAEALKAAAKADPKTLVVALTGAGHADRSGWTSRKPPFASAAQLLPADQLVTLTFTRPGGTFWGCHAANGGPSDGCKPYEMPVREPVSKRGIVLDMQLRPGFDGLFSAGRQYSASEPAVG